jgi:hypothetical protein
MMPSVFYLYLVLFAGGGLALVATGRVRWRRYLLLPASIHRCRARPLFAHVGSSVVMLDALVETCDDPTVPRGTPFSLRLTPPTRRGDYLFSRVRASVERGHALLVDVEDHLTARRARLCANGWTVVLNLDHASGWPACSASTCTH